MSDHTPDQDEDTYWRDLAEAANARNRQPAIRTTLKAAEALPSQVTAGMWIESKGPTPEAALCGLRRQLDHWQKAEGWELADGAVSIDHWPEDTDYQASVRLVRSVTW